MRHATLTGGLFDVEETAWSGWREIERYRDGLLHNRQAHGRGIDEIVLQSWDVDGNGQLDAADLDLIPLYDSSGNVVAMAAADGTIVARYDVSPFGEEIRARVDDVAPEVHQVRIERREHDALLIVETTEELATGPIDVGSLPPDDPDHQPPPASGDAPLVVAPPDPLLMLSGAPGLAQRSADALAATVTMPIADGPVARRRIAVVLHQPPAAGTELEVHVAPRALADPFLNEPSDAYVLAFTWPDLASGQTQVLADLGLPVVERASLVDGHLQLIFSEPVSPSLVGTAVELDGTLVAWSVLADGYTVRTADPLASGSHTVTIAPGAPLDLSGEGLSESFTLSFDAGTAQLASTGLANRTTPPTQASQLAPRSAPDAEGEELYRRPDERETTLAVLDNDHVFHGRPVDPVTGLVYFRHRWYDLETGRFVSADPLGYVDGPSTYQFAGYSPFTYGDPLGLCVTRDIRCFGSFLWEFSAGTSRDVGHMLVGAAEGTANLATVGAYAEGKRQLLTFFQSEGALNDRAAAALAAGRRARLAAISFGFSEAEDAGQHLENLIGFGGIERGGATMGTAIANGDMDLLWLGVGEAAGGVGQFAGLLASVGAAVQYTLKARGAGWVLPESGGGARIGGRWYTEHALERMAPRTPQVMAELESRVLARARAVGIEPGTPEFGKWWAKYRPDPRNVPPSVVEAEIAVPASTNVRVITNVQGDVVTVIPGGG